MSQGPYRNSGETILRRLAFNHFSHHCALHDSPHPYLKLSQVDYNKLAEVAGFKNPNSAGTTFNNIRKKLVHGASTTADSSPASTPKKGQGKAAAKPAKNDADFDKEPTNDGEVADNEQTPGAGSPQAKKAKAPRKSKAKATPIKTEEDEAEPSVFTAADNEENTEETPVKPKRKYTRKPKDPNAPPAKRAKKQAAPAEDDEAEPEDEEDAGNNASIFGGDKAIKAEEEDDNEGDGGGDFTAQTASQEQLAAENTLVPDAV